MPPQIRQAQFDALRSQRVDRYIEDTVRHLMTHFPDPCAAVLKNNEGVRTFVCRGMDRAGKLNVNTPAAVTALLELWLQFGENFERSPARTWTVNILSNPELPGAAKVDVIRDRHYKLTGGCVMVVY